MNHTVSIVNKLNQLMAICTAIFAVLCCIIMIFFKTNEEFFDTHGKIANLAESEQKAIEQENTKLQMVKRNVAVTLVEQNQGKLEIPLSCPVAESMISVREEFVQHKIVITLQGNEDAVRANEKIFIDSDIMEAIGVYRQKDDLVIEIYGKDTYGYDLAVTDQMLSVSFSPIREKYDQIIVVGIPFDQKNRIYSEDWQNAISQKLKEKNVRLYLASQQLEPYALSDVVIFANSVRADAYLQVQIQEQDTVVLCNPTYFIPTFGNAEFAGLVANQLQKNMEIDQVTVAGLSQGEDSFLAARMPAVMVKVATQGKNSIEDEYNFNHKLMDFVSASIMEYLEQTLPTDEKTE